MFWRISRGRVRIDGVDVFARIVDCDCSEDIVSVGVVWVRIVVRCILGVREGEAVQIYVA